ncbi:unnamed protein product [Laminaria digitata]
MTRQRSLTRRPCTQQQGELDKAAELCASATRRAPRNARARYMRGAVAQRAGRRREAAEHACEASRLRPDLPALQLAAGALLYRGKEYTRALRVYEAAIENDPAEARYHLGAAAALRKLGRRDEATASFLQAADTADPCDAHVHYKLGQHLRSMGGASSCSLAAEAYGRALARDPGHALAAFWLQATRKRGAAAAPPEHDKSGAAITRAGSANNAGRNDAGENSQTMTPLAAPREYVVGLYNSYAETFDSHLQGALGYRTPTVIVETLGVLFPGKRWARCLDLGCGTGLSGQAASSVCHRLAGVDLSPAMVQRARQKKVYHRLLVGDVTDTVISLCRRGGSGGGCGGAGSATRTRTLTETVMETTVAGTGGVGGLALSKCVTPAAVAAPTPAAAAAATATAATAGAAAGPAAAAAAAAAVTAAGGAEILPAKEEVSGDETCGGDLVLSCDVFGYIGDLRPCFEAIRHLFPGENDGDSGGGDGRDAAVFAFSAEAPPSVGSAAADAEAEGVRGVGGARGGGGGDAGGGCQAGGGRLGYELQGTGR